MDSKNHEAEWARLARIEMCRSPLLGSDELGLFEWHVTATENLINQMMAEANKSTREEVEAGSEDVGSGWITVDYFVKRTRYGQVNYLVSLVETFLTVACERLEIAVGKQNILFRFNELSGEKLAKRRKFL